MRHKSPIVLLVALASATPGLADGPETRSAFEEAVVVTAQWREEDLREVPISLTAFTAAQIAEAGIETPEDVSALTPNVFIADSFTVGNTLVLSRGVGQANNGDSPLAVVVDGVYQGNQKQLQQQLFDVERIEVLTGPEGALYGRNSIGGALNIISKAPTASFEGSVGAGIGNGSSLESTVAVSGPLGSERVLYRVAARHAQYDGYIENTFLGRESDPFEDTTGRLRLRFLATERLTIDWRTAVSTAEGGAASYAIFPTTGFANDFSFLPQGNILGFSERDLDEHTLTLDWRLPRVTLTAITGLSHVEELYRADADFTHPGSGVATPFGQIGQGQDLDVDLLSHELRVASPDDRRWRWLVGGYTLGTERALTTRIFADTDGTVAGFVPIIVFAEENDNRATAWFAQTDLDLAEAWSVSASLRHDRDRREQRDLQTSLARSTTFDRWQPRLTVSWRPRETFNAYLNLGTGFRSGGYNAPTITPDIFEQEVSQNVELGFKSTLVERRVRLDGAVYFSRLDDAQYLRVDFTQGRQFIDNIREVEHVGLELRLAARPVQGLEVWAALGLNDSEVVDFDGTPAFRGNQTPINIRSTVNLGAQYARPLGGRLVGVARLDFERRGSQYWAVDNLDVQRPVELLAARFTLRGERWSIAAWGKNLTDERYYVEYGDAFWIGTLSGDDLGWLGRPRTYGVEIERRF